MSPRHESGGDSSLFTRLARGFLWLGGSQLVVQALHLVIRLLLARLLAPRAFGVMAMAVSFLAFAELVLDLGLGAALVHRRHLTEEHRSTAFWAAAAVGLALAALTYLGAPWLAAFYRDPEVTPVLRVLALSFVLAFPQASYRGLAQRSMRFGTLAAANLGGLAAGGSLAIVVAIAGGGVWALVTDHLAKALTGSLLLMGLVGRLPRLLFSGEAFGQLWRYGLPVLGSQVVNFFGRFLDNILVGRYLGAPALGLYSLGYQAVVLPLQYVGRPLAAVTFPAFAALRDDPERVRRAYLAALRVVVLTSWPLAAAALFLAGELVPWLLGSRWLAAAEPLRLLAGVALLQAPMSLSPALFRGLGRPGIPLQLSLVLLLLAGTGFVVGLRWGVTGVAAGYLVAMAVFTPLHFAVLRRLLGLAPGELSGVGLRALPPLLAFGAATRSTLAVSLALPEAVRLPLALASGLAAWAGVSWLTLRPGWETLLEALRRLRAASGSET